MARSMTNVAVGRVNRRFLLLALILGVLSAVLVYAAVSRSGGEESSAMDITVVVAKEDIPANTEITAGVLEEAVRPAGDVPEGALGSISAAEGRFARIAIKAKDIVSVSNSVSPAAPPSDAVSYAVRDGERAVAITVERVTTAGGLVLPGDHVDVLWVPFKGAPAYTLLNDVTVVAVEQTVHEMVQAAEEKADVTAPPGSEPDDDRLGPNEDAEPEPDAVTITLLLTPERATKMFCAQWQAIKFDGSVRMTIRAVSDTTAIPENAPACPAPMLSEESAEGEGTP